MLLLLSLDVLNIQKKNLSSWMEGYSDGRGKENNNKKKRDGFNARYLSVIKILFSSKR